MYSTNKWPFILSKQLQNINILKRQVTDESKTVGIGLSDTNGLAVIITSDTARFPIDISSPPTR